MYRTSHIIFKNFLVTLYLLIRYFHRQTCKVELNIHPLSLYLNVTSIYRQQITTIQIVRNQTIYHFIFYLNF